MSNKLLGFCSNCDKGIERGKGILITDKKDSYYVLYALCDKECKRELYELEKDEMLKD